MAPNQHICGFYYTTPRVDANPWEDQCQRHYLPQLGLKSHTTILSRTSRTLLTQTFTNPDQTKAIKNVRYTFPLYDGVSVVGFTCRIGDRLIKGQVKEKEKAKSDFNQAVERGQVAGLLEQLPDAADVFTTTVGNIPPGATIVAEIAYLGELKHDAQVDGIRFTIPTAIAPRYGKYPGELLSKPASAQAHASSGMEIVIDAVSDDYSPIKQLRSPTHPISVSMGVTSTAPDAEPTMTKASATLSLGTAELDTDFIIQVVAKDTGNPTAILETHPRIPQQRALMTTLVPKFSLPSIRPEIVFICDRSGSMGSGSKIPTAVEALKLFLKSLPVGVKFNICSFGSRYTFLWPKSKSYSQDSLEEAIKHVQTFHSDYGGTEIFEPLKATFENRYKDMELEIMLLTDGDVWGHESIFAYLNEHIYVQKEPVRVFTLGVGLDASSALVEGIARAGNGFSQAVDDNEKMDRKIVRMLKGALSPHITDYSLEVKYADDKQGNSDDGFELVEKVTDGLRVNLNLRDTDAQHEAGVNNGKGETVHQLAARKAVSELEEGRGWLSEAVDATGAKLKEKMEGRWDELVEREAVRLGVKFQVGGKWCSFVALEQNPENQDAKPASRDWKYLDGGEPIPSAATGDPSLADYQQGVMLLRQEKAAAGPRFMMMASASAKPGGRGGAGMKGFRQRVTDKLGQQHQPAAAAAVSAVNPADVQLMSSEPIMEACADPLADDVVATVLAIAFLRLKVAEEEEAWELVVEKAEDWLNEGSGVGEEVVRAMKEKAEALVKGKE
ncbi:putative von willebrand domain containing protein [Diplodia seriata]|uniref:Putative von willebrand domain containing protein n=1 Tax=Diplodia seriata TaxID=420778 RepID=A0A0G2DQX3_9PEZI|nr:putative von willebrand domain containing protein [Diplodia seriata]